jgi:hypothetical protein
MKNAWIVVVTACVMLQGCASFYSEKEVEVGPLQSRIKKSVNGATAKLSVAGLTCSEASQVKEQLSSFAAGIGLQEVTTASSDYEIVARITRCDGFNESLYGKGSNVLHYGIFAITLLTVPYFYDENLQIELMIRRRGKELYKGQQGASAFVISGWLITPAMITNSYGNHRKPMIQNILAKQLKEIEEQGVF